MIWSAAPSIPAICAIQDRLELLRESFVKTNRLALMWAMPFGAGVALFAADLVRFGIGEKWSPAVTLLQVTGVVAAISQVGFNWDDYFRARGKTMPLAIAAVASTITFLAVGIPLLFAHGLTGLAVGIAAQCAVHLAFRAWYLSRLFEASASSPTRYGRCCPRFRRSSRAGGACARDGGARSASDALAELIGYVVLSALATWLLERGLVREAIGYLMARASRPAPAAPDCSRFSCCAVPRPSRGPCRVVRFRVRSRFEA